MKAARHRVRNERAGKTEMNKLPGMEAAMYRGRYS